MAHRVDGGGATNGAGALRIVVVAVNREDGQSDVEILILVVDARPAATSGVSTRGRTTRQEEISRRGAGDADAVVRDELEGDGAGAHRELAQGGERLEQRRARRSVLVEEVACEEQHVDLNRLVVS